MLTYHATPLGLADALNTYPELEGRPYRYACWSFFFDLNAFQPRAQELAIPVTYDAVIVYATRVVSLINLTTFQSDVPILVTLRDNSSADNINDQQTYADNLFGTAQLPQVLPWPRLVRATNSLRIELVSQSGAGSLKTFLTLHGLKVDRAPASDVPPSSAVA